MNKTALLTSKYRPVFPHIYSEMLIDGSKSFLLIIFLVGLILSSVSVIMMRLSGIVPSADFAGYIVFFLSWPWSGFAYEYLLHTHFSHGQFNRLLLDLVVVLGFTINTTVAGFIYCLTKWYITGNSTKS